MCTYVLRNLSGRIGRRGQRIVGRGGWELVWNRGSGWVGHRSVRVHVLRVAVSVTACSQHCHGGPGQIGSPAVAQGGPRSRLPWLPYQVVLPRAGELDQRLTACASACLSPGEGCQGVWVQQRNADSSGTGLPIRCLPAWVGRRPTSRPKIQEHVF